MCSFNFLIEDFKDMQMDSHKDQIGPFKCILAWEQLTKKCMRNVMVGGCVLSKKNASSKRAFYISVLSLLVQVWCNTLKIIIGVVCVWLFIWLFFDANLSCSHNYERLHSYWIHSKLMDWQKIQFRNSCLNWHCLFQCASSSAPEKCYSFYQRYPEYYPKRQLVLGAQWETLTHAYKPRQSCQMSRGITLIE